MRRGLIVVGCVAGAVLVGACQTPGPAGPTPPYSPQLSRVSLTSDGVQANGESHDSVISTDGRFVAYDSFARNLVPGDTNNRRDVFVRDRENGITERVSVDASGAQAVGGDSTRATLSADGRFVAYVSGATNLVPGDTNEYQDLFIRDRSTGATTRIAQVADIPVPPNSISGGPDRVANVVPPNPLPKGVSGTVSMSADGRYLAFASHSTILVPDDTNGAADVFVHDRDTGTITRVSTAADGTQSAGGPFGSPSISADGRLVTFSGAATDLVPGDTNGAADVFVHDRDTGTTTLVSVASGGGPADGSSGGSSISADGRHVTYISTAANIVPGDANDDADVFVHDRDTGTTTLVSVATDGTQSDGDLAGAPAISADGRYVTFTSNATNLFANALYDLYGNPDTYDVFVHDRDTGETTRVSVVSGGAWQESISGGQAISGDGRYITFESAVPYLVPGDTNGWYDIFVSDQLA